MLTVFNYYQYTYSVQYIYLKITLSMIPSNEILVIIINVQTDMNYSFYKLVHYGTLQQSYRLSSSPLEFLTIVFHSKTTNWRTSSAANHKKNIHNKTVACSRWRTRHSE